MNNYNHLYGMDKAEAEKEVIQILNELNDRISSLEGPFRFPVRMGRVTDTNQKKENTDGTTQNDATG